MVRKAVVVFALMAGAAYAEPYGHAAAEDNCATIINQMSVIRTKDTPAIERLTCLVSDQMLRVGGDYWLACGRALESLLGLLMTRTGETRETAALRAANACH